VARIAGTLYTRLGTRFNGFQQIEAYIGYLAPTSYITNPAACRRLILRRNTTIAYRTANCAGAPGVRHRH